MAVEISATLDTPALAAITASESGDSFYAFTGRDVLFFLRWTTAYSISLVPHLSAKNEVDLPPITVPLSRLVF